MFTLQRVAAVPEGAFGVLLFAGVPFAVTLERTYDAAPAPCCHRIGDQWVKLRPGRYRCPRTVYHKGGYRTFEIPVPGHDRILLHKANWEGELDGCVAIGQHFADFAQTPGLLASAAGFGQFLIRTADLAALDLEVVDPPDRRP